MPPFVKDPTSVLDYGMDWSAWLAGDAISTSAWTADGMAKSGETATETTTAVWLGGGTTGVSYRVTNHVTTVAGRVDARSLKIYVEDR